MTDLHHPRYRAGAELGRGAQGVVLRVTDVEQPELPLVAKIWTAGAFPEHLLAGEFALLARLSTPGLARARDYGRDAKTQAPFLVEELVDGPDAASFLRAASSDAERARRLTGVLADVSQTLGVLHGAGFVHGDVKPAHVRVHAERGAVLLDLGAAVENAHAEAREASGPVAVTREYAAPEVLAGAPPSPASDQFSLGALAWALCVGVPPAPGALDVRRHAPWVAPAVGDLVDRLLAPHPADRPSTGEALRALGEGGAGASRSAERAVAAARGREREIGLLLEARGGVRYLVGPPGSGKSHVLAEAHVRALLAGRDARRLAFPCDDAGLVRRLIAWLRGAAPAWPFAARPEALLLLLDPLDAAPEELRHALEAFRCRPGEAARANVVAATRTAVPGAPTLRLGPLDAAALTAICRDHLADPETIEDRVREAAGSPGWLLAALGRVPLDAAAAQERARTLSASARAVLAATAVVGGAISGRLVAALCGADAGAALAELAAARLIARTVGDSSPASEARAVHTLNAAHIAADLAESLASFDDVDRVADAVLADGSSAAATLLAVAGAPRPPSRRTDLLVAAAARARSEGLRSVEADALLALAADPRERRPEVLLALDRVTRGGGSTGLYAELAPWLQAAAGKEPRLEVLALRRRAELSARAGDFDEARALAERAAERARVLRDPLGQGLSFATLASIALHRADWAAAERAVSEALSLLAGETIDDEEELARLEHNRGVVALYRERLDEATASFERSLAKKRAMGDRGGIWASLVNLGIAHGKAGRRTEAETALDEAVASTRAMGLDAGTGWALAARAELLARANDARGAERAVAEAELLAERLPASVRVDLALVRAEIALLEGDGEGAARALEAVGAADRTDDALTDARALVLEAKIFLTCVPVERRAAARKAVAAIRRARAGGLPEPERDAKAVLLSARRRPGAAPVASTYAPSVESDDAAWSWLAGLTEAPSVAAACLDLARLVVRESGAERAFVVLVGPRGDIVKVAGTDIEGLPIADAAQRLDPTIVRGALDRGGRVHHRDVETVGGRGSRLAAAAAAPSTTAIRAAVVAEHRFSTGCFDAIDASVVERWARLAAVAAWGEQLAGQRVVAPGELSARPKVSEAVVSSSAGGAAEPWSARIEATTALPVVGHRRSFPGIVGESAALRTALARLDAAVDSELPVLVVGETGVGKERFARAVHELGQRSRAPFVAVSCAAIPETLFEAELFGHARGSFTGAEKARPGLLARAQQGTLFLDEVGELPLSRQAVLLRALETRTYRAVGSDDERDFDVRIVSATNRDLADAVKAGTFRRDLLYRLNVLEVRVPALRERPEDVAVLARHFLDSAGSDAEISEGALAALEAYSWPGNVRELQHQMQRLAAARVERVDREHLPRELRGSTRGSARTTPKARPRPKGAEDEKRQVEDALSAADGNITRAARRLGLTRHGLKKRMVRLGMREGVRAESGGRR